VQFTSSAGASVAWATSQCDVGYVLDDSEVPGIPTEELRLAVHRAMAVWTDLECGVVSLRFDGLVTNPRASALVGAMENSIVFVRTGWKHKTGDVAMTTLTYEPQTGRIRDADIELNLQGYSFSLCGEDPQEGNGDGNGVDLEYILRHEAGHFFGLDHSTDVQSTMLVHPPYCHEKPPESLALDDMEGYCHIYGTDARQRACATAPEPSPEFIEDDDIVETPDTADPETPPTRPRNCSHNGWDEHFSGLWPAGLLLFLAGWLVRRRWLRGERCSLSGSET
jgi:hypothetical protein